MLRSSIAVFLCWLFVAPFLAALSAPELPSCCLRTGGHHCGAMQMDGDSGPQVKATSACPYQKQLKPLSLKSARLLPAPGQIMPVRNGAVALAIRVLRLAAPAFAPIPRGPPTFV